MVGEVCVVEEVGIWITGLVIFIEIELNRWIDKWVHE